jgi:hypothetical protein
LDQDRHLPLIALNHISKVSMEINTELLSLIEFSPTQKTISDYSGLEVDHQAYIIIPIYI